MVKELDRSIDEQLNTMFVYNINGDMSNDKDLYLEYKNGVVRDLSYDDRLNLMILDLLVNSGFSLNLTGTYLYRDVIRNIVKSFDNNFSNPYELKSELDNVYSQFYFDIARNDRDMGLKTFHFAINNALNTAILNMDIKDDCLFGYEFYQDKSSYGMKAFDIACYIFSRKSLKEDKDNVYVLRKDNHI